MPAIRGDDRQPDAFSDVSAEQRVPEDHPLRAIRRLVELFRSRGGPRTGLMADERFTVDGTLIEASASQKSFQRKDQDPPPVAGRDFRGQARRNDTHASRTDPRRQALSADPPRRGPARLPDHLLIENRSGLVVDAMATPAVGTVERDAAMLMLGTQWQFAAGCLHTVGADHCTTPASSSRCFATWASPRISRRTPRGPAAAPSTAAPPGRWDIGRVKPRGRAACGPSLTVR
jgi:hypothetical protein